MADVVRSLQVSLWVQPDGPNTPVRFLGCHAISSATKPRGGNTLHHCPDPVHPGRYAVSSKTKAPPGLTTYTIESKVTRVFDYLENIGCPVPVIAQVTSQAPKNEFWNWDRAFIFPNSDNVQEGISDLVSGGEGDEEMMQSFDMEADDMLRLIPLRVYRDLSIEETQALNHLFACDIDICGGSGQIANKQCDTMYAVTDAIVGSAAGTASVWAFRDSTWTVTAADPFAVSENIAGGTCFALDKNTRRIVVFRGTTDVSAPAEAAYSDDGGATWTNVNIGSTNGEFVSSSRAIYSLNQNNVWVGTDLGRIYFSNDGGASWAVQENAGIHTADWNWIHMLDDRTGFAAGDIDVVAITVDGGSTWSQLNAPGDGGDILAGAVVDANTVWVGTDDGRLYFTNDGGVTWTERVSWAGAGTGEVRALHFENNMIGFMMTNDAGAKGNFYQTRNGGYTWEVVLTENNSGLNSMLVCNSQLIWGVGEPVGGKPGIYKLQPQS